MVCAQTGWGCPVLQGPQRTCAWASPHGLQDFLCSNGWQLEQNCRSDVWHRRGSKPLVDSPVIGYDVVGKEDVGETPPAWRQVESFWSATMGWLHQVQGSLGRRAGNTVKKKKKCRPSTMIFLRWRSAFFCHEFLFTSAAALEVFWNRWACKR